jgi:hypothetical protein
MIKNYGFPTIFNNDKVKEILTELIKDENLNVRQFGTLFKMIDKVDTYISHESENFKIEYVTLEIDSYMEMYLLKIVDALGFNTKINKDGSLMATKTKEQVKSKYKIKEFWVQGCTERYIMKGNIKCGLIYNLNLPVYTFRTSDYHICR